MEEGAEAWEYDLPECTYQNCGWNMGKERESVTCVYSLIGSVYSVTSCIDSVTSDV